ncbi:MAG: hypothetical protein ACTSRK_09040 [Promethearchaeota archaeon]
MESSSVKIKYILFNTSKSFIYQVDDRIYEKGHKIATGVDIRSKRYCFQDNFSITVSLWDIANTEKFSFIQKTFYKSTYGTIIVSSIESTEEMNKIKQIIIDVSEKSTDSVYLLFDTENHSEYLNQLVNELKSAKNNLDITIDYIDKNPREVIDKGIIKALQKLIGKIKEEK